MWTYSADNRTYELHWVRVGNTFVAALYHPPTPVYNSKDLLDYIEACVAELGRDFPAASIVLAGDLNQLTDQELEERTGLTQIVQQRTRTPKTPAQLEVEAFFQEPLLQMTMTTTDSTGKEQQREQDPMLWWRQNANRYPMLRSLAKRYLGPPPSSVDSERLFSSAGDICTESRSRLLADNAEMLIVLKVNMLLCNSKKN